MKNLTVVGKLLILMAMLGSLTACKTTPYNSQTIQQPVVKGPNAGVGLLVGAVGNAYVSRVYGLDDAQKAQQNAAVYTALESEYGRVISWYDRDAMGRVKAVHGYPQGRGYCKVIYSAITVRGKTRHFEETACQNYYDSRGWKFVRK